MELKKLFNIKFRRPVIHFFQKIDRGFSDEETWSLDYEICKFILPRLKRFRDIVTKEFIIHPADITDKKWEDILNKIIYSIEQHLDDNYMYNQDKEEKAKIKEGFDLLHEYFFSLWW